MGTNYNATNNPFGTYYTNVDKISVDPLGVPTNTNTVTIPIIRGTVTQQGSVKFLIIPEIWNPHDFNARITNSLMRPNSLRLVVDNTDPLTSYLGTNVSLGRGVIFGSETSGTNIVIAPTNTELTFLDGATANTNTIASLFREPTALRNYLIPAGSSLQIGSNSISADPSGGSGYFTDFRMSAIPSVPVSNNQFVGIFLGSFPFLTNMNYAGTNIGGTNYPATNYVVPIANTAYQDYHQLTFRMQAKVFNDWVDYDIKGWARIGSGQSWSYGSAQVDGSSFVTYLAGVGGMIGTADVVDPRTSRWGMRSCYPNKGNFYQNYGPQGATWTPTATNWTSSNNILGTHRPVFNFINATNIYNTNGPNLNNPYPRPIQPIGQQGPMTDCCQ